jgi:hypothetical protein
MKRQMSDVQHPSRLHVETIPTDHFSRRDTPVRLRASMTTRRVDLPDTKMDQVDLLLVAD